MRLDTHLHVMLRPFYGRAATDPDELLASLAECGLDGGWVSAVDSLVTSSLDEQRRANDALAEMARKYPGRFEGMCTVTPAAMEEAVHEVERAVTELHLIGIKLHPWLQAFSVTHPGVTMIMEAAGALGAPVLFHDGSPPYSTPRQVAWLARKHPNVQVILGHSGLADLWRDAADAGRTEPNIWLQPSVAPLITIRMALQAVGPERMQFGTDGGFGTAALTRYCMANYRAGVGDGRFDEIVAQGPKRVRNAAAAAR